MFEREIKKYKKLNELAENGRTVILGSGTDAQIPIAELTDAFEIDTKFYNRSADKISIKDATAYYKEVIEPIHPERIILHIGEADIEVFQNSSLQFDNAYRTLITSIRKTNPKCNIGIVSLKNIGDDTTVAEINRHLRMIAESEHCEFEDISKPRVWNPSGTKSAMTFAIAMGLSRKIRSNKSLYDLAKVFFCFDIA